MSNKLTAQPGTEQKSNEALVIAFQDFNGVFLAKISNSTGRETFAYGETKAKAQLNAIKNYNRKYNTFYFAL